MTYTNQSSTLAIEVMRCQGERSRSRLRDLVDHYARVLGEDREHAFAEALETALRAVLDFNANA